LRLGPRSLVTIDLAAVRANVRTLRAQLSEATSLCAVVKADAYGHGAVEVGRAAREAGAAMLAVVTAGEAAELRDAGYEGPLLVMGPLFSVSEAEEMAARQVQAVILSPEAVSFFNRLPSGAALKVHVKVDSGMYRQGLPLHSLPSLLESLSALPQVELAGVTTHMARADEDAGSVAEQLAGFHPAVEAVRRLSPGALVHAANSAATFNHPEAHYDMVRCGIALYGLSPFQSDPADLGLRPVLRWTSTVASIKTLPAGRGAGYGHTFRPPSDTLVGLVPLGYADGVRRDLGNKGQVLIRGRRYPMVGRVSMDSFLVDLGPQTDVQVGDPVTLVGQDGVERVLLEELAAALGTINYELSCAISLRRAVRRFVDENSPSG
jgi:alanine racemase